MVWEECWRACLSSERGIILRQGDANAFFLGRSRMWIFLCIFFAHVLPSTPFYCDQPWTPLYPVVLQMKLLILTIPPAD